MLSWLIRYARDKLVLLFYYTRLASIVSSSASQHGIYLIIFIDFRFNEDMFT